MPLALTRSMIPWMDEDLVMFRDAAARFVSAEMAPNDEKWRKQQNVGREIWLKAGAVWLLCTDVSSDFGGAGGDFRQVDRAARLLPSAESALNMGHGF